jgi:hypothetical protein
MDVFIALILDDQVMHDHASSHDLSHHLCAPCPCRVANNRLPRLEHTKSTLHILPACFLSLSKPYIFLLRWFTNCLYKSRPVGVDAIVKIVAIELAVALLTVAPHQLSIITELLIRR